MDTTPSGEAGRLSPDLSAEQLAALAAERPDLWPDIWAHPNAYPDLRQWIIERGVVPPSGEGSGPTGLSTPAGQAYAGAQEPSPAHRTRTPRRRLAVVLAASVAAVLALGGGTAALALTGTWPFGADGVFGDARSGSAQTAAESERATFADGIEERWRISGAELGGRPLLFQGGGVPPLGFDYGPMGIKFMAAFDGGAVVPYAVGDQGYAVAWLDAETGEKIWESTERSNSSGLGCLANPVGDRAYCIMGRGGESELVTFAAGLDAPNVTEIAGEVENFAVDDDGVSTTGTASAARFDRDGAERWVSDLELEFDAEFPFTQIELSGDRTLVRSWPAGWQLFDAQGRSLAYVHGTEKRVKDQMSSLECDAAIAGDRLFLLGDCPEVSAQGMEQTRLPEVPRTSTLVRGETDVLAVRFSERLIAYSADSGEELWSKGTKSEQMNWGPQPTDGSALLLQYGDEDWAMASVDAMTGETRFSKNDDMRVTVVSGALLSGLGEGFSGLDPATGEELWHLDAPGGLSLEGAGRGIAGLDPDFENGDASEVVFYAPVESGSGGGTGGGTVAAAEVEIPDTIPASCPADTILLAWAELADGWVIVCGITLEQPSYVAYQPSGGGKVSYSDGATKPTGETASAAVRWDAKLSRYTASLANGSTLTLDYDIGTATVRDGEGDEAKTIEQQRCTRMIFVVIGGGVRTADDVAGDEGAFSVQKPKDTAEDQIRYMIEVLEKAYDGRALVKDALPKLQYCTASAGGYGDTVAAMQAVRDNRAELLEALASMPVDKIPEGEALLDDLTDAIRYSHQANVEYVAWAEAANASGCAALSPTGQSAAAASDAPKERFASRWNSVVAPKFGVRTFDAWYI